MAVLHINTPEGISSFIYGLHQAPANCGCKILGHPTWNGPRNSIIARIIVAALFDYKLTESDDKGKHYNQPYKRGQILFSYTHDRHLQILAELAGGDLLPPAKGMYGTYDVVWGMWKKEDYPLVLPEGYAIQGAEGSSGWRPEIPEREEEDDEEQEYYYDEEDEND